MTETGTSGRARTGKPGKGGAKQSAARLAAVQALYQAELTGAAVDAVLVEFVAHRLDEEVDGVSLAAADRGLLELLVHGVGKERDELDDMLAAVLDEDWPVERLETLLQILLRVGALELTRRPEAPVRVVVSEYVDLAGAFFGGKEPGLVNGVLDRLARALRPDAFDAPDALLDVPPDAPPDAPPDTPPDAPTNGEEPECGANST
jgi:N utilization substance protein B